MKTLKRVTVLVAGLSALVVMLSTQIVARDVPTSDVRQTISAMAQKAHSERDLASLVEVTRTMDQVRRERIQEALRAREAARVMLQKAREEVDPVVRMQAAAQVLRGLLAKGESPAIAAKSLREAYGAENAVEMGTITGTVTVGGEVPPVDITVVAFDIYGYVAGVGDVSLDDGSYGMAVPAGQYYLMTVSEVYVDEMYDDILAPFGSKAGWRTATLVEVTVGGATEGIDFDLMNGATVSGIVYGPEGGALTGEPVVLNLTWAQIPGVLLTYEVVTDFATGGYEIRVPGTGDFKLSASSLNYGSSWYQDKESWEEADPIHIPSLDAVVGGVDFHLPESPVVEMEGGAISGTVSGPNFFSPILAAVTIAFDLSDTTVAGVGLATILASNAYTITGLDSGSYYVYADDIFGRLASLVPDLPFEFSNYVGEFYDDALTPDEATPVPVNVGETTENINFKLDRLGGTIQGTVTNPEGEPLESVIVIAIDGDLLSEDPDPFLTRIEFVPAVTDSNGQYSIPGLAEGEYVVRTLGMIEYGSEYVDEYYEDVYSLWDFGQATRIPVTPPGAVEVNITLERGQAISGSVMDQDGTAPIPGSVVLAFDPDRGLPEIAYGEADGDGEYELGPLPADESYAVLALSGDDEHLSEFYDGVYSLGEAELVPVGSTGIDFTLDLGATLRGFVKLPDGQTVGADTLYQFPVIAYDSETGEPADYAFAQFPGGFRMRKLLPGNYKIAALPILWGYAVTYWGGGTTFDDPNSGVLALDMGVEEVIEITLGTGSGQITGTVRDGETGDPVDRAAVVAYDATGHAAGVGIAGVDLATLAPTVPGDAYTIAGLRPGEYYVRTFALSHVIPLYGEFEFDLEGFPFGDGELPDFSELFSNLISFFDLYQDEWYDDVPTLSLPSFEIHSALLAGMRHGMAEDYEDDLIPFYLPLPFHDVPPPEAAAVSVSAGGTAVANFELVRAGIQQITGVEEGADVTVPTSYALYPPFPNPFNPSTQIRFDLPSAAQVSVTVYDLLGHEVRELADERLPAGVHTIAWNGRDDRGLAVPSGVYLIRMTSGAFRATRKVLLMK